MLRQITTRTTNNMAIKIHFAGCDNAPADIVGLRVAGVRYRLFTSYPFIVHKESSAASFRVDNLYEKIGQFRHTILDSGIFTLMYGAGAGGDNSPEVMREWMHRLVRFVVDNNLDCDVVEVDCQKICSPEVAWELRKEMRELLPEKNNIINVYHTEDGEDGFRRLVEFSDYIAIGCPELRHVYPSNYQNKIGALTRLAKSIKPSIKIHLLGCTEKKILLANSFCDTSDSTSWVSGLRFGTIGAAGKHISQISPTVFSAVAPSLRRVANDSHIEMNDKRMTRATKIYVCAKIYKQHYSSYLGNQE